jgi:hypothetical protein
MSYTFHLPKGYVIQPNLQEVTPVEWSLLVDFIINLKKEYGSITKSLSEQEIAPKYEKKINHIQMQLEQKEQIITDMREQISNIRKDNNILLTRELTDQRTTLETKFSKLMEQELISERSNMQKTLLTKDQEIKTLTEQIIKVKSEMEQNYKELLYNQKNMLESNYKIQITNKDQEISYKIEQINKIKEEYELQKQEQKIKYDRELSYSSSLNEKYKTQLEEQKQEQKVNYDKDITRIIEQNEKNKTLLELQHQEQLNKYKLFADSQLQEQNDKYNKIKNDEISIIRKNHENEIQSSIKKNSYDYEENIASLKNENNNLKRENENKLQQQSLIILQYKNQIEEKEKEINTHINNQSKIEYKLQLEKEKEIELLNHNYKQQIDLCESFISKYKTQLEEKEKLLTTLESKSTKIISDLELQYEERISKMEKKKEMEIESSNKKNIREIEELKRIYESKIKLNIEDNEHKIKLFNTENKEYKKQLEEKERKLTTLENKITDIEIKHEKQLNHERELHENQLLAKINSTSKDVSDLSSKMGKFLGGSNDEKGVMGELFMRNIIENNDYLNDSVLEDTSGQTARGDLFLTWRELRCMIEIKNKKVLKLDDITKFERDIKESIDSENNINCAIFISLLTHNFPKYARSYIQYEMIHGINVILIHHTSPYDILYALCTLNYLVVKKSSNNEQMAMLVNIYKETVINNNEDLKNIIKLQKTNMTDAKIIKLQRQKLENRISNLEDYERKLADILGNISESNTDDESTSDVEDKSVTSTKIDNTKQIHKKKSNEEENNEETPKLLKLDLSNIEKSRKEIIRYYISNNVSNNGATKLKRVPNDEAKMFGIDIKTAKLFGGYELLTSQAIEKYITDAIPSSVIEKVANHKESELTKPELIARGIKDYTIRDIGHVGNSKKSTSITIEYCKKIKLKNDIKMNDNIDDCIVQAYKFGFEYEKQVIDMNKHFELSDHKVDLDKCLEIAKTQYVIDIISEKNIKLMAKFYIKNNIHLSAREMNQKELVLTSMLKKISVFTNIPHEFVCEIINDYVEIIKKNNIDKESPKKEKVTKDKLPVEKVTLKKKTSKHKIVDEPVEETVLIDINDQ